MASNIIELQNTLDIRCPMCNKQQKIQRFTSTIYGPISPFCCDIMRHADTIEWNNLLDNLISEALSN